MNGAIVEAQFSDKDEPTMGNPVDSTTKIGWKAERDMLPEASELEFLRWFYLNADDVTRSALVAEFYQTQQKSLPQNLR
ncbi:hypothetical protein DBR00_06765 [Pseudomonas sp. HMWF032]|nr:hypothetical protein DBR00_06765 [Pseudomonas sp. HMWF032]PTT85867.1 hypothetical protein DBR41_02470 [Pseudomonas sp. HMWF010]